MEKLDKRDKLEKIRKEILEIIQDKDNNLNDYNIDSDINDALKKVEHALLMLDNVSEN